MRRRQSALARERDRIARAIGVVVMSATPCAAVSQACSFSSAGIGDFAIDGSMDTQTSDAVEDQNDLADIGVDALACTITATPFDAGRVYDAEGGGIDLSCTYSLPCGLPPTLVAVGCETFIGDPDASADTYVPVSCTIPEGQGCTDGSFTPGANGALQMICLDCFGGGRRPRGVRKSQSEPQNAVAHYFSRMAHDESASILAFSRMRDELVRHAAPRALRAATRRAMRDERRHARIMSSLARAHGGNIAQPRSRKIKPRSIEAMAVENIVEGCIHETFGAIVLRWQSLHAPNEKLRASFASIADDEANHAALSWALASWIANRLDFAANRRVRRARDRAVLALRKAVSRSCTERVAVAGLPSTEQRAALFERMVAELELS